MSQPYSFPVLENDELLPSLEELEVALDPSQLAKPSYEAVRPVFEHIVLQLTEVTREELTQPVFTAMDVFEYPELHDESIATNNFFRLLCKLMLTSGVKDFSWRDVFKPEPARLRRHLSAVVNFAKFREDKAAAVEGAQAQVNAIVEGAQALESELARNMSELRRLQAARTTQASAVQAVEMEESAAIARNTALNKQAQVLQAEVRQLKAQVNTLADTASQVKLDLTSARQDVDSLQDQVVQSPDKHRQAIAELAAGTEAKRTYCAQLASQTIDNDKRLEMVVKFEKEVARCIKLEEELDVVVTRKKDVSQQVKDAKEGISTDERALAEIVNTGATLRQHQATLHDKFQRQEAQGALKTEAAASYMEEAQKSKEAVEAENAAAAAKAAEDEAYIRSVRERMQEVSASRDMVARTMLDKYTTLRKSVSEYNRRLEASMAVM